MKDSWFFCIKLNLFGKKSEEEGADEEEKVIVYEDGKPKIK